MTIIINRPVFCSDGDRHEYLRDTEGNLLEFPDKETAIAYLLGKGYIEEYLEYLLFEEQVEKKEPKKKKRKTKSSTDE